MTITADKAAAAEQAGQEKGARPALRRALGRGLESLLRPAGTSTAGAGASATAGAAAAQAGAGAAGAHAAQVLREGTGGGDGAATPGVIAELQAQAARKADGHEVLDLAVNLIDLNPHQTRSWTEGEVEALDELRLDQDARRAAAGDGASGQRR